MSWNEWETLCEEKCTLTCSCGAVFEVIASRQERFERIETFTCPVCATAHTAKSCLPPRVSLIIAPAAKPPQGARPAA